MIFRIFCIVAALFTLLVVGVLLRGPENTLSIKTDYPYDRFEVGKTFVLNDQVYTIFNVFGHKIEVGYGVLHVGVKKFIIDLDKESVETLREFKLYDLDSLDLETLIHAPKLSLEGSISKNLEVDDKVIIRNSDLSGAQGIIKSISNNVYVVEIINLNLGLILPYTENELEKVNDQQTVAERQANKYEPGDRVMTTYTVGVVTISMRQFKNGSWLYDVITQAGATVYDIDENKIVLAEK